jgi:large subunit ribosomal protein L14e
MALIEEGRVCIKKLGRDAGDRAVITKVIDGNFVEIISHSRSKSRRCNTRHLEFLSEKIDPKDKAAVNNALEIMEKKVYPKK